ncbi:MAG: hypothetical protein JNJ45_11050 [Chthonomonas sp.]|nr:hypothetical protein [Chthonomonas sp.]
MDENQEWIERSAKLFEAGSYPDKGVEFEAADLERLAQRFGEPVPVLIEHATSPLELGRLTQVWVEGSELFGTVHLSPEANALIERSDAKSLSIGLSAELDSIEEVSLVQSPRVSSARLFSGSLGELVDWRSKFLALRRKQVTDDSSRQLRRWIEEGKLLPAQSEFARVLLESGGTVPFGGDATPVAQVFARFIESQPPHRLFGEQVPHFESAEHQFSPDEREFYQRHFPSVALPDIARAREAR